MADFSVRLIFYDDEDERSPVILRVSRGMTANQLYSKVTTEVDITGKFQLLYRNDPIEQCDTPLSQIFQGNEVDVLLLPTVDGGDGHRFISPCVKCPNHNPGDEHGRLCEACRDLADDTIIDHIVNDREDTWRVFCKVFSITADIQRQVEDNSEDPVVRCIDVMHHLYHLNTTLTWDDIKATVKKYDNHLAEVISKCDFSHLN